MNGYAPAPDQFAGGASDQKKNQSVKAKIFKNSGDPVNIPSTTSSVEEDFVNNALGVVIHCRTKAGQITTPGNAIVSALAYELIDVDDQSSISGITLTIETGGANSYKKSAYVEYGSIDRLCLAIDKLGTFDPKATKFNLSEAIFTLGDVKVRAYNTQNGFLLCAISISGASAEFDIRKINEIKSLILKAKSIVDECRHVAI